MRALAAGRDGQKQPCHCGGHRSGRVPILCSILDLQFLSMTPNPGCDLLLRRPQPRLLAPELWCSWAASFTSNRRSCLLQVQTSGRQSRHEDSQAIQPWICQQPPPNKENLSRLTTRLPIPRPWNPPRRGLNLEVNPAMAKHGEAHLTLIS